jgi:hypothetical protein
MDNNYLNALLLLDSLLCNGRINCLDFFQQIKWITVSYALLLLDSLLCNGHINCQNNCYSNVNGQQIHSLD